jgi:hypothetical protein
VLALEAGDLGALLAVLDAQPTVGDAPLQWRGRDGLTGPALAPAGTKTDEVGPRLIIERTDR